MEASKMYIYVLKLEKGKYYIGKTSSPSRRVEEHISGSGSGWTSKYKAISVEKILPMTSHFDEDKVTKEYMASKGIDNVRGGSYVEIKLDSVKLDYLQKEIWSSMNCCSRCGRNNHFVKNCFAKMDVNGNPISEFVVVEDEAVGDDAEYDSDDGSDDGRDDGSRDMVKCFRCGRMGHYSSECFARTHTRGYYIS